MKATSFFVMGFAILSFHFLQPEKKQVPAKVIFAVTDDGMIIEPIARVENGKLLNAFSDEEEMGKPTFAEQYYTPGTVYTLIGGGKPAGKVTVIKNDPGSECTAIMAEVKTSSPSLRLKRFEMSLATDISSSKPASGLRRLATTSEKAAIEKLVKAEFIKNKAGLKLLKQVKLTVIDADNNKVNEIVGSYTVAPSTKERALLFFIATKNAKGSYVINYSDFQNINEEDVMSGDITSIDAGVYQEMLLDVLDTDNSGISKIFTMGLSFEGAGFNIYQRNGTKWEKVMELSNYHCGY